MWARCQLKLDREGGYGRRMIDFGVVGSKCLPGRSLVRGKVTVAELADSAGGLDCGARFESRVIGKDMKR